MSPNSSVVFKKIIGWFCTSDKTETMIGFKGMPWLLILPCLTFLRSEIQKYFSLAYIE